MPFKFVHLTDTHLVPEPQRVYGVDVRRALDAAIEDINTCHGDAAFAIITGDLTHRGDEAAYRHLAKALKRLAMPCHLVLGNHDARETFRHVFPERPCDDNGFVQYDFAMDDAAGIVIDTLLQSSDRGGLCDARLAWLTQTLEKHRDRDVHLFMHHAPCDVGIGGLDLIRLTEGRARLKTLIARHGRVRAIYFGHLHRSLAGTWAGVPFFTLPATCYQVALELSRRVTVPGNEEPPAYGVVLSDAETLVVHTDRFTERGRAFLLDDPRAESALSRDAMPSRAESEDRLTRL